jgi:hypothetical protein
MFKTVLPTQEQDIEVRMAWYCMLSELNDHAVYPSIPTHAPTDAHPCIPTHAFPLSTLL